MVISGTGGLVIIRKIRQDRGNLYCAPTPYVRAEYPKLR